MVTDVTEAVVAGPSASLSGLDTTFNRAVSTAVTMAQAVTGVIADRIAINTPNLISFIDTLTTFYVIEGSITYQVVS